MLVRLSFLLVIFSFIGCGNNPTPKPVLEKEKAPNNPQNAVNQSDIVEMVLFEGGTFSMGSDRGMPLDKPVHQVLVKSFYLDKTPVTVAQFRKFVDATGHKTDAENFGDSGVFDSSTLSWSLIPGASWKFPFGKDKPQALDDHPVTQVSWNDAVAYSRWAGKRLPTEAEWEYAARCGGKNTSMFSWGEKLIVNGKYLANVWQGELSFKQGDDGYVYTSPVGYYGVTPCGLTEMGGNVWNWCSDGFQPYPGNNEPFQPNSQLRVIRGGSFLFDQNGENSFSVWGRASNTFETSLFNTGFRCAKDATQN